MFCALALVKLHPEYNETSLLLRPRFQELAAAFKLKHSSQQATITMLLVDRYNMEYYIVQVGDWLKLLNCIQDCFT